MKGSSEATVRAALEELEGIDEHVFVYKPPDDARNWKPSDFIVWHRLTDQPAGSTLVEVKSTEQLGGWTPNDPRRGLRPSQKVHAHAMLSIGIPYLVVIHWTKRHVWTISPVKPFLDEPDRKFTFEELSSSHGIRVWPKHLGVTLRLAIAGELGL